MQQDPLIDENELTLTMGTYIYVLQDAAIETASRAFRYLWTNRDGAS